jgi:hypothetical protein
LQAFAQIVHDQRHVLQITGLAVAMAQAGEDAEHLDVALHAHPFEITVELAEIGLFTGRPALRAASQ